MMTPEQKLARAFEAAKAAGHIWPDYAACEAAEETGWFRSQLCLVANNLFGQKEGFSTEGQYPMISLPTWEWDAVKQAKVFLESVYWPQFPDWAAAFKERMELLKTAKNKDGSLKYAEALAATTGADYIIKVSKVWATDPQRAANVEIIHRVHSKVFTAPVQPPTPTTIVT